LERFLFARNPLAEILAKGNPWSGHRAIQGESSGTPGPAAAGLQGTVKFVSVRDQRVPEGVPMGVGYTPGVPVSPCFLRR
jgi:hypothetical protein